MEAMKLSGEIVTLPLHNANMEETIDLSRVIHSQPHSTFIFQIKGDGMAEANMPDGAMAVIDRSLRPGTGDIILAMINGEYTVKRLVKAGRNWVLHSENAFYKPILITEDTDFQVWGVVTAVIVDMRK
ncbi:LexA family transcriptional regulator [Chitinophaga sp. sic0106]|uniref:LexA family protein n=1 Tax=Chitinophaga sp. sic0106 TaxID=2854785 RepID=UPI00210594B0|nr:S24 family peptidase [Chitinophaga sp. sic0106]